MVAGWPGRAGRVNLGPTMRDERRQVDPTNSLSAAQLNQEFWQVGAMGLCSPKVSLMVVPTVGPILAHIRYAFMSWDQVIYENVAGTGPLPPGVAAVTPNGTGDISVEFDPTVLGRPDENGVQQQEPLSFQFGFAGVALAVPGKASAEFELVSSVEFRIRTYRVAAATDEISTLMVW